jgi:hypothetical protein
LYRELVPWILSDLERNQPAVVVEILWLEDVPRLFAGEVARERGWGNGREDWDTPELKAWKARLAQGYRVAFIDPEAKAVVFERKAG